MEIEMKNEEFWVLEILYQLKKFNWRQVELQLIEKHTFDILLPQNKFNKSFEEAFNRFKTKGYVISYSNNDSYELTESGEKAAIDESERRIRETDSPKLQYEKLKRDLGWRSNAAIIISAISAILAAIGLMIKAKG